MNQIHFLQAKSKSKHLDDVDDGAWWEVPEVGTAREPDASLADMEPAATSIEFSDEMDVLGIMCWACKGTQDRASVKRSSCPV